MRRLKQLIAKCRQGIILNDRGILLVSVAVVFTLAAAFVTVAATRTVNDRHSTVTRGENMESFYAAQAGEQAMKAAIREDAMTRFAAFQNAWVAAGAVPNTPILATPENFFANQVALQGVRLPNGACYDTVSATINFVPPATVTADSQAYRFTYDITSQGTDPDDPDRLTTVASGGEFWIQVDKESFANYALFTGTHTMTSGTRVWFTSDTNFTGNVHTNGSTDDTGFAFAFSPTFTGHVSSVADRANYYNNGHPVVLNADNNAPDDTPVFGEGFERGADAIPLPDNAFDQREAAVGGPASDNSELRAALGLAPGGTPPPDGIYVPNDGTSLTGGIYVQGNASDVLPYVDGSDQQCYQITHTNGSTSNIVVDEGNDQTIVDGITYQGVPNGALYVAGNVNSFGGPTRPNEDTRPPAIESDTALSLFAEGDVTITRDVVYEDDPTDVTTTNVLGIFTPGGDIRIGTSAPDNIIIHSTLMTSDENGVVQVNDYNYGDWRGVATIYGGVISSYYGAFGTFNRYGDLTGYSRNFRYDQRLGGGLAPPFFPTTITFNPATSSINETAWSSRRDYVQGNAENFQTPTTEFNFDPDFSPGA